MSEAELSAQIAVARSHAVGDLLRRSAARVPGKTASGKLLKRELRTTVQPPWAEAGAAGAATASDVRA
jgi:hypothetical protein